MRNRKQAILSIIFMITFCLAVISIVSFLPKSNDNIYPSKENFFFENNNPRFNVGFGNAKDSQQQYIRFESKPSTQNPFNEDINNVWDKVKNIFSKKKGFEMSLSSVGITTPNEQQSNFEIVKAVLAQINPEDIKADTEVIEVGRIIGEEEVEGVSKETVINRNVYPGIDLEYQIIEGYGLKEDIVIKDMEAYLTGCGKDTECMLPLNEFTFNLKLDEGVELKKINALSKGIDIPFYYLSTKNGEYIAHFLPIFAIDGNGTKTNSLDMVVDQVSDRNYKITITLDPTWLYSPERVLPVRIDPSIVQDTTLEFSVGFLDRVDIIDGPQLSLKGRYISGEYISEIIDFGAPSTLESVNWLTSGIATGDGEIPYSTTGLIMGLNLNNIPTSTGTCASDCDATLVNFSNNAYSGWTTEHKKWGEGALFCDGVDDYAYTSDNEHLKDLDRISFELWFKPGQQLTDNQTVAGNEMFGFGVYQGEFGFWVNSIQTMVKTEIPDLGIWAYWVGVYDGLSLKLYRDGVLVDTYSYSEGIGNSNSKIRLCSGTQDGSNYTYSRGVIDTVRVYSRALTESEIVSNYNAGDIQFGYRTSIDGQDWTDWSVSEEDFGIDFSGYVSNSSTDNDLIFYQPITDEFKEFNGIDDFIDLGDIEYIWGNGYTLSAYINLQTTNSAYILGDGDTEGGISVEIDDQGFIQTLQGGEYYKFDYKIEATKDYFITLVGQEESVSLYINGEFIETIVTNTYLDTANSFQIGRSPSEEKYIEGIVGEISLYSSVKNIEEIFELYRQLHTFPNRYTRRIEALNLSDIDNISVNIATDIVGESISLNYGPSLYSVNEYDSKTVGMWKLSNEDNVVLTDIISNSPFSNKENPWSIDLLINTGEGIAQNSGNIVSLGEEFAIYTEEKSLKANIGGVDMTLLSEININSQYFITIVWDGVDAELFINGINIKKLEFGDTVIESELLTIDPTIIPIDTLRISNVARTEREIRQVHDNIIGQRGYKINTSFKADLSIINSIENLDDLSFNIDERPYGTEDSIENLIVGDKVVVKEIVDGSEYIAQAVVNMIDNHTGDITIKGWETGSTIPTNGFTQNASVFRWQKEYLTLIGELSEDREDIKYFSVEVPSIDEFTLYIENISTNRYNTISSFEPIESIQYLQYKLILSRRDLLILPYLTQLELVQGVKGPTMEQLMRHGKWFDSTSVRQPFWWVSNE